MNKVIICIFLVIVTISCNDTSKGHSEDYCKNFIVYGIIKCYDPAFRSANGYSTYDQCFNRVMPTFIYDYHECMSGSKSSSSILSESPVQNEYPALKSITNYSNNTYLGYNTDQCKEIFLSDIKQESANCNEALFRSANNFMDAEECFKLKLSDIENVLFSCEEKNKCYLFFY